MLLLFTLTFTTDLVKKTKSRQTKCRCHLKQSVLSGRTFNVGNLGAQIQTVSSQNKKEKKPSKCHFVTKLEKHIIKEWKFLRNQILQQKQQKKKRTQTCGDDHPRRRPYRQKGTSSI